MNTQECTYLPRRDVACRLNVPYYRIGNWANRGHIRKKSLPDRQSLYCLEDAQRMVEKDTKTRFVTFDSEEPMQTHKVVEIAIFMATLDDGTRIEIGAENMPMVFEAMRVLGHSPNRVTSVERAQREPVQVYVPASSSTVVVEKQVRDRPKSTTKTQARQKRTRYHCQDNYYNENGGIFYSITEPNKFEANYPKDSLIGVYATANEAMQAYRERREHLEAHWAKSQSTPTFASQGAVS